MSMRETGPGLTKEEARAQAQRLTREKADQAALERLMMRNAAESKPISYLEIFTKYYKIFADKLCSEVEENPDFTETDFDFELFPFLVVVGMTAFADLPNAKEKIGKFIDSVLPAAYDINKSRVNEFADRMQLYSDISTFKYDPLGVWCLGVSPVHLMSDSSMRCAIVLGDLLYNESYSNETMAKMWIFSVFAEEIPDLVKKYTEEIRALAEKPNASKSSGSKSNNYTSKTDVDGETFLVYLIVGVCCFAALVAFMLS